MMAKGGSVEVEVSAPGKVLLAGGYLVLDRAYSGLVLGTSARFKTRVFSSSSSRPLRETVRDTEGQGARQNEGEKAKGLKWESVGFVRIESPQFTDGLWEYGVLVSLSSSLSSLSSSSTEKTQKKTWICHLEPIK
jgi:phosphomevalonate kinase